MTGGAKTDRVRLPRQRPQMPGLALTARTRRSARILALALATVLTGCASGGDSAVLGPNPGGGFYCPHNAFIGCAYP
jgi:hypothetical protein